MEARKKEGLKTMLAKRELHLPWMIDKATEKLIHEAIVELNEVSNKPITFFINSGGGYMDAIKAIREAIANSKAVVHGVATTSTQSGAFFILQACHKRLASRGARLMFNPPDIPVDTEHFEATRRELLNAYKKELKKLSKRSRQPFTRLRSWGREAKVFDGEDAYSLGFVDELISNNLVSLN